MRNIKSALFFIGHLWSILSAPIRPIKPLPTPAPNDFLYCRGGKYTHFPLTSPQWNNTYVISIVDFPDYELWQDKTITHMKEINQKVKETTKELQQGTYCNGHRPLNRYLTPYPTIIWKDAEYDLSSLGTSCWQMVFTAEKEDKSSFPDCVHQAYGPSLTKYYEETRKAGLYELALLGLAIIVVSFTGCTTYVIVNNRATIQAALRNAHRYLLSFLSANHRPEAQTHEMVPLIPNP